LACARAADALRIADINNNNVIVSFFMFDLLLLFRILV